MEDLLVCYVSFFCSDFLIVKERTCHESTVSHKSVCLSCAHSFPHLCRVLYISGIYLHCQITSWFVFGN